MVSGWSVWRTARVATSVVVLIVASYYLLVGFDNITNPTNPAVSNWPFVRGVMSGEGVPPDNGIAWRFIDATWLQACAYIMVMVLETLTGILLLVAGVKGLRTSVNSARWREAQVLTFAGGALGLLLFFFGFIVIGGNWFIMYLNSEWNGMEPAFQISMLTMGMLILTTAVMIGGLLADGQETGNHMRGLS